MRRFFFYCATLWSKSCVNLLAVCVCDGVLRRWPGVRFGLAGMSFALSHDFLCKPLWEWWEGKFFLADGRRKDCGGSGESRA